ncbi:MAG: S-layer homology domain-containing protein [Defluviitaleaceae bacterium]|nr:S-layer homology domain-containing protein [Defluviitaleaceae bacterium]
MRLRLKKGVASLIALVMMLTSVPPVLLAAEYNADLTGTSAEPELTSVYPLPDDDPENNEYEDIDNEENVDNEESGYVGETPLLLDYFYTHPTTSTAPPNVTSITAAANADGTVELTWPSSFGANEYEITIDGNAADAIVVTATGDATQQFVITNGLQNGTTHDVGILAGFDGVFSDTPATTSFTLSLGGITRIRAIGNPGEATVDWSSVSGATRYRVERAQVISGTAGSFVTAGYVTAITFTDTGLSPGIYRWRVIPVNYAGASEIPPTVYDDAEVTAITARPTGIPGNFQVSAGISRTAELSWNEVALADNYRVYFRLLPSGSWSAVEVGNALTHTLTGLQNENSYEFAVRAGNSNGWSIDRALATEFIYAAVSPFGIEAGVWFEKIYAHWTARSIDTGIRPFELYVRETGSTVWTWVNNPAQPVSGISWTNDHSPLVRQVTLNSQQVWRVDVPGLAGNQSHDLRIVANADGEETIISGITPPAFDRQGFAFHPSSPFGVTTGGYNPDGTLRNDAVVVYVTNDNRESFVTPFSTGGFAGLFPNSRAANRASDATPLGDAAPIVVRVLGALQSHNAVLLGGNYETMPVRYTANVTIEGVGTDARLQHWGLYIRNTSNIEIRNLHFHVHNDKDGIFLCSGSQLDGQLIRPTVTPASVGAEVTTDAMSANAWIHHNTFTSDGDWDVAVNTSRFNYITLSYNDIRDNSRGGLFGGNDNVPRIRASVHNNWYFNIHQHIPLMRHAQAHIYNNLVEYRSENNGMSLRNGHFIMEGNYFHNTAEINEHAGGSVITNLTTGNAEINALAATLEPNVIVAHPSGTTALQHGMAADFLLFSPREEGMGVHVLPAADARDRVRANSGIMRNDQNLIIITSGSPVGGDITFIGVAANGTAGDITTTRLTLNFSASPNALTAANITITGSGSAVMVDSVSGIGNSRNVDISGTWDDGVQVTVSLTNPANMNITPLSQNVILHSAITTFPVTINDGGIGASASPNPAASDSTVTVNAGTREGFDFDGWTSSPGVTFANASSENTTFTMLNSAVTVTANWTPVTVTPPIPTQLPAPSGLAISGTTLSWNAVGNASGYRVYADWQAVGTVITATSLNLANLNLTVGTHSIQVRAIGNVTNFTNSELSVAVDFAVQVTQPPTQPPTTDDNVGQDYQDTDAPARGQRPPAPPAPSPVISDEPEPTPPQQAPPFPPQQAPALPASQMFDDVAANAWYHNYVTVAVHSNLFQGMTSRIFAPHANMTRAMFVQVLANLEGADLSTFVDVPPTFNDVQSDSWYFAAVEWAASLGIVIGIGDGNFGPNQATTREQIATMMYRYVQVMDITLPQGESITFTDQAEISPWATQAVEAIQVADIIFGRPEGSFDPQATATRAEVAAMFVRMANVVE